MAYLLAVDDERDIVELISRFAEHEGHTIDTADNGTEALRLCGENDYFELGIDDYVVKPFSPRELMARVKAVLSRHTEGKPKQEIVIQGLRIDALSREVFVDGVKTEMTAKEYELLSYLIQNKGVALTRENILNAVWGYDYYGDDRTVDWQIKLLRGKLGPYRKCIVTLRGTGYRFDEKA